jgi:hypothetical protein
MKTDGDLGVNGFIQTPRVYKNNNPNAIESLAGCYGNAGTIAEQGSILNC